MQRGDRIILIRIEEVCERNSVGQETRIYAASTLKIIESAAADYDTFREGRAHYEIIVFDWLDKKSLGYSASSLNSFASLVHSHIRSQGVDLSWGMIT